MVILKEVKCGCYACFSSVTAKWKISEIIEKICEGFKTVPSLHPFSTSIARFCTYRAGFGVLITHISRSPSAFQLRHQPQTLSLMRLHPLRTLTILIPSHLRPSYIFKHHAHTTSHIHTTPMPLSITTLYPYKHAHALTLMPL